MATAIVTGATGILGRQIVFELGSHPDKWSKVHALSRSKKEEYPDNVVHNFIDLQGTVEDMQKRMEGFDAEFVFFSAYLQKSTDEEMWDVNGEMLENFLAALEAGGKVPKLKRIILVTGAKQFGVQLGAVKNPMVETDPLLEPPDYPVNFYYRQQDALKAFSARHPHVTWVVTYPNDVIGFAAGNFMNLALSIGLYVVVSREMDGSTTKVVVFPGSERCYTGLDCFTSAKIHAEFCHWAATADRAGNEAYNVFNGDVESWQNLFPRLAARYGMRVMPDQFVNPDATRGIEAPAVTTLADKPPVALQTTEAGLEGTSLVGPGKLEGLVDLVKWSDRQDVMDAWDRLAEREGLAKDTFGKATWTFLAFVLGRNYDLVLSMSKARKHGFDGYIDTWESFSDVLDQLEREKLLPSSK